LKELGSKLDEAAGSFETHFH